MNALVLLANSCYFIWLSWICAIRRSCPKLPDMGKTEHRIKILKQV